VYDLLTADDNIFLVDIRTEETREKEGLPQLKLGARYKVAAFPVQVGGVHVEGLAGPTFVTRLFAQPSASAGLVCALALHAWH
jgi:hypothetical protein